MARLQALAPPIVVDGAAPRHLFVSGPIRTRSQWTQELHFLLFCCKILFSPTLCDMIKDRLAGGRNSLKQFDAIRPDAVVCRIGLVLGLRKEAN